MRIGCRGFRFTFLTKSARISDYRVQDRFHEIWRGTHGWCPLLIHRSQPVADHAPATTSPQGLALSNGYESDAQHGDPDERPAFTDPGAAAGFSRRHDCGGFQPGSERALRVHRAHGTATAARARVLLPITPRRACSPWHTPIRCTGRSQVPRPRSSWSALGLCSVMHAMNVWGRSS